MAVSTTQSIWRSGGGDQTRTAYCGSGVMAAQFYFDPALVNTTTAKISSATGAAAVILPAGAIITAIQFDATGTGGTTPTMDMGFTLYSTGTASPTALIDNYAADAGKKQVVWGESGAGASVGVTMSTSELVYITGGANTGDAATGGAVTGTILYYVVDPYIGQQNV
jgi:hypothetical protein|tara:strand:- start:1348 stop:1848 length:501 start_codon:yes stop_codon:yes gene_type:complete